MEIDLTKLHDETDFLKALIRLGHEAERRIQVKRQTETITWGNLQERFFDASLRPIPASSRTDYTRWTQILSNWATAHNLRNPESLAAADASRFTADLLHGKISRMRILRFYRRVWRTFGWDDSVWLSAVDDSSKEREFYRRLSIEEVRTIYAYLRDRDSAFADMVMIGYSTGLRMSDVAELERNEISDSRDFLELVPNKTRTHKSRPLKIPLTVQARETIIRRLSRTSEGNGYLFDLSHRKRPSRKIAAAFHACHVLARENGRASFHSLRATFISLMDEAGVPPHITDAITGHGGGGMHARYTQPSAQALQSAVMKAIPPL